MADLVVSSLGTVTNLNNTYATVADLSAYLPGSTSNTTLASLSLNTASRWIENHCDRKFWLDPNPLAKTFVADSRYQLDLRNIPFADIATTTGLVIKTDASGDGTFETTWTTADYELLPVNAPYTGSEANPWTGVRAVGTLTFPLPYTGLLARADRVQITAKWGWPAVPSAVQQACLLQAARLFSRSKSPDGVAGFGESVALRVSNQLDPDVAEMLRDYTPTATVGLA